MIGYVTIDMERAEKEKDVRRSWVADNWKEYFYPLRSEFSVYSNPNQKGTSARYGGAIDPFASKDNLNMLREMLEYTEMVGAKPEAIRADNVSVIFRYGSMQFILPADLVTVEYLKEYDDISPRAIMSGISGTAPGQETGLSIPDVMDETASNIQARKQETEDAIKALEEKAASIEAGTAGELADLKEKLDAIMAQMKDRQKALMEELSKKMAVLESHMAEMKKQMFMLETQIYGSDAIWERLSLSIR